MLERAGHAVEDASIQFDRRAFDVQAHLDGSFLGRLPHHTVQAFGQRVERHHAGAQQIFGQRAGEAGLRGHLVFGRLHGLREAALHRGHVVDRLGHHARKFLEAREAIHLQRIELDGRTLAGLQARRDLRVGLQLDVAQLAAQSIQIFREFAQRHAHLRDVALEARTRDRDFAGLVDQAVQQRRLDAHRGGGRVAGGRLDDALNARRVGGRETGPVDRGRGGVGQRLGHELADGRLGRDGGRHRRLGDRGGGLDGRSLGFGDRLRFFHGHRLRGHRSGHGRGHRLGGERVRRPLQALELFVERVDAGVQRGHRRRVGRTAPHAFLEGRFQAVRQLAQAHGAGEAGAALERVQRAQRAERLGLHLRRLFPRTQVRGERRQQLLRLFGEDLEQLGIDRVLGVQILREARAVVLRLGHFVALARLGAHAVVQHAEADGAQAGFRRADGGRLSDRFGGHRGRVGSGVERLELVGTDLGVGRVDHLGSGDGRLGEMVFLDREGGLGIGGSLGVGRGLRIRGDLGLGGDRLCGGVCVRRGLGLRIGAGLRLGGGLGLRRGLRGSGGSRLRVRLRLHVGLGLGFGLRRGLDVAGALHALVVRGLRHLGLHRGLERVETRHQRRGGTLQEAGGELVQQAADLFGHVVVQARLVRCHLARLRHLERVLQAAGQRRQFGVAHGGRIAGQRMRQRHGLLAHRARQLEHPLGERGAQAARLLVGLVQEDVEQAQADAQRTDDLVVLGVVGRQLGADGERVERARAGGRRVGDGGVVGGRLGGALRRQQVERGLVDERGGDGVRAVVGVVCRVVARRDLRALGVLHRLALVEIAEVEFEVGRRVGGRVLHRLDDGALFQVLRRLVNVVGGRFGRVGIARQVQHEGGGGRVLGRLAGGLVEVAGGGRCEVFQDLGVAGLFGRGLEVVLRAVRPGLDRLGVRIDAIAQRGGGGHDGRAVEAGGVAGDQRLDPALELVEHVQRERAQLRIGLDDGLGQARVVQLLAGPGGFAEVLQADHARAALEGVERAADGGDGFEVLRILGQLLEAFAGAGDDLVGLLEEDVEHLVVFGGGGGRHGRGGRDRRGRRRGGEVGHRLGDLLAHFAGAALVAARQRLAGGLGGVGDALLVGGDGLLRQLVELVDDLGLRGAVVAGRGGQRLHLLQQFAFARGGRVGLGRGGLVRATHHRLEAAGVGIELEQRLGQLRLHAQQVDEETQCADVGGQATHGLVGQRTLRGVDLDTFARLRQHGIDLVAHAHDGVAGLV